MELTAQAILTILEEHMAAELVSVAADMATTDATNGISVTLPTPTCYEFGAQTPIPTGDFPCIRVIPAEDNRDEMTHEMLVEWFVLDGEQAERANIRYGKAIENILVRHPDLDGVAHGGVLHGVAIYPGRLKGKGSGFLKSGVLAITYYCSDKALMNM